MTEVQKGVEGKEEKTMEIGIPKRRGRPKKYNTEEERYEAIKACNRKNYNLNNYGDTRSKALQLYKFYLDGKVILLDGCQII